MLSSRKTLRKQSVDKERIDGPFSMNKPALVSTEILAALAALADRADAETIWPAESWDQVTRAGALRWSIPQEFGGDGLSPRDLLTRHEQLAGACLTTMFLLSQRE